MVDNTSPQPLDSKVKLKEDSIMKVMGETLMRKDLHSDPFSNKELEIEAEKKRK